jgi:hypothetical protein
VRKGLGAKGASAFATRQCPFPPAPAAPRPPRRGVERGLPSGYTQAGTLSARRRCGRSLRIESGVDRRMVASPHPNSRWSRSGDGHRRSVAGTLGATRLVSSFPASWLTKTHRPATAARTTTRAKSVSTPPSQVERRTVRSRFGCVAVRVDSSPPRHPNPRAPGSACNASSRLFLALLSRARACGGRKWNPTPCK